MPSIAGILNTAPVTPRHRLITLVIGLGLFFDIFDVFLAGVLSTVLTNSFGLSLTTIPAVLGAGFLGMFFGAMLMGAIADHTGRRKAFLLNLGIYSIFTLAGGFSPNAQVLILMRFFAGLGIGAQLPLSDAYLSEVLPARVRGKLISLPYTIGFCGVPAVGLGARVLVPLHWIGVDGWRWLFVVGGLGGILIWALQGYVVESPRWLESQGRMGEAWLAVTDLLGVGSLMSGGIDEIQIKQCEATRPSYLSLFAPAIRNRTLMLYVFQIFQAVGYYAFGTMVPLVLAHKGFSVLTSLTYTAIAFLGYPVGSALSLAVVERVDRRVLIIVSAGAMAALGLALGFSASPLAIGVFGILYTMVSNFFSNAFHILQGEIFPTSIRGRASGSAYGLSRLSSAAMPFVLLPVLTKYWSGVMFAIVAGAMVIVIADIGLFAPSTTGRALEQI